MNHIYCWKISAGCNPHVLGWRHQPCVSSLQLDVIGCPVVIAAAIPDAMLLPTDKCFAHEVSEPVCNVLTCPKYALWDSNPGFGGRRLLLLNDEGWRGHPYTDLVASEWLSKWGKQLVARRLWCTDHQLGCLVWWLNPACSHERYTTKPLMSLHVRDSWLDVPWRIGCIFVSPNPHPAVGYTTQEPALVWPMDLTPCP